MSYLEQLNNIYVIDGKMRGFDKYMSLYIVKSKEIALVDTGERMRFEQVKAHPMTTVERDSRAAFMAGLKALNLDLEPLHDGPGRPAL